MEDKKRYEVTVIEKKGTCDTDLFEEMAKRGDITAVKVSEIVGAELKILGYAECNIITDDKNFNITYFDSEEYGLFSSGSEIFKESVTAYFGKVKAVRITEIKTKKGKTYKAVPVLGTTKKVENKKDNEETTKNEENNDLPF